MAIIKFGEFVVWGILAALIIGTVFSSCTKEMATEPTNDHVDARFQIAVADTIYYIYRVGQLDTLLDTELGPPSLSDGDTICFAADTLDLDNRAYTIENMSVTLLGDAPGGRPLLSRDQGSGTLFYFRDQNPDLRNIEIANIRFESGNTTGAQQFLACVYVSSAEFVNVDFDLTTDYVTLYSDDITIDSCEFAGENTYLLRLNGRVGQTINHAVENSSFINSNATEHVLMIEASVVNQGGTLEFNTNSWSSTTSSESKEYLRVNISSGANKTLD